MLFHLFKIGDCVAKARGKMEITDNPIRILNLIFRPDACVRPSTLWPMITGYKTPSQHEELAKFQEARSCITHFAKLFCTSHALKNLCSLYQFLFRVVEF